LFKDAKLSKYQKPIQNDLFAIANNADIFIIFSIHKEISEVKKTCFSSPDALKKINE